MPDKEHAYFFRPPKLSEIDGLDAVGIATALRSMNRDDGARAMAQLAAPLAALKGQHYHLKICSTFDSSPDTGNIATTGDILAAAIDAKWTAIIGGQPSLGRYCVFGNLFANAADGNVYRIDRHPVTSVHPVTPMTEGDLRRHLAKQGWTKIRLIDRTIYSQGIDALVLNLQTRIASGETHTLFDASDDAELQVIGQALDRISETTRVLSVGASSVAEALAGTARAVASRAPKFVGPIFVLAGSRSSLTAAQVENAEGFELISAPPNRLIGAEAASLADECKAHLRSGANVLLQISAERQEGVDGQTMATATAGLVKNVVSEAASGTLQIGCLAIAGGVTSSLAVQAFDIDSLSMIVDLEPGVPLIRAHSHDPGLDGLPPILKGGQMGSADLFTQLARSGSIPPSLGDT